MLIYVDTSAAAKLLVEEAESAALAQRLDRHAGDGHALMSSLLLETELRRLVVREGLEQSAVTDLVRRFDLYELPRPSFHQAGVLPGENLRTLDALHLATALRVGASLVISYDVRQVVAAQNLGLVVESP